jgi:hypothetical protein
MLQTELFLVLTMQKCIKNICFPAEALKKVELNELQAGLLHSTPKCSFLQTPGVCTTSSPATPMKKMPLSVPYRAYRWP